MRGVSDSHLEAGLCNFLEQNYIYVLSMQEVIEHLQPRGGSNAIDVYSGHFVYISHWR